MFKNFLKLMFKNLMFKFNVKQVGGGGGGALEHPPPPEHPYKLCKEKHLEISLFYTCIPKILIWSIVPEI